MARPILIQNNDPMATRMSNSLQTIGASAKKEKKGK